MAPVSRLLTLIIGQCLGLGRRASDDSFHLQGGEGGGASSSGTVEGKVGPWSLEVISSELELKS